MTITVDARERRSGVPERLCALDVEIEVVTLAVGDYAVGDRVVERKTVADLYSSLTANRLWSQVAALRRDPRKAYLLVEGVDLDDGPVPSRALRGALFKVMDNGIRILRTDSAGDTALWLRRFRASENALPGHALRRRDGLPGGTSVAGSGRAEPRHLGGSP